MRTPRVCGRQAPGVPSSPAGPPSISQIQESGFCHFFFACLLLRQKGISWINMDSNMDYRINSLERGSESLVLSDNSLLGGTLAQMMFPACLIKNLSIGLIILTLSSRLFLIILLVQFAEFTKCFLRHGFFWNYFWSFLYKVVLVSSVQWSESAVCIHISPLFWTSFPFGSPQSSLCYTVGSH